MSIATFLRGAVTTIEAGVDALFAGAKAAVAAAPFLPANIKTDLTQTLTDAENDVHALEGLAGTLGGTVAADAVDDLTTLIANTAQNVSSSGADLSKLSAGEKATLQQTWQAMRAQGDALVAQIVAGVNIIQQAPPAAPAPQ